MNAMTKVNSFKIISSNSANGMLEATVAKMNGRFISDTTAIEELNALCEDNGIECKIEFVMDGWAEEFEFPFTEFVE
jgi:hypothetical protein